MKTNVLLLAASAALLLPALPAQAQYYVTDFPLSPTGVSNEGIVVGGQGKDTPFILWNPFQNTRTLIGGMASGDEGAAGPARITADGKTVYGSNWNDKMEVPTSWENLQYPDFKFDFKTYCRGNDFNLFLVGTGADENGVIRSYPLKSANQGKTWTACYDLNFTKNVPEGAVQCMSCMTVMRYFIGTDAGKIYTSSGNASWSNVEVNVEGDDRVVKSFTAMDFARTDAPESALFSYGAIGFECEDGTFGAWYTTDSKFNLGSFSLSTGVAGIPAFITHVGQTWYMVTKNGHIQKSSDYCASWQDVYVAEGIPFRKIAFADADNGIAIADQLVLITADGGQTWKTAVVEGGVSPFDNTLPDEWNDVLWYDGIIALAGSNGRFYTSDDNGKTFRRNDVDDADNADFSIVMFYKDTFSLIAGDGLFFRKTLEPLVAAYCPSRYDVATGTWTPLNTYAQITDRNAGSSWGISTDGAYVAGIAPLLDSEVGKVCGYAAVWDGDDVTSLGTMFTGSPTRANRVSDDGSVVVGFQDKMGPWMASVWRRQSDGSYRQELLFKDKDTKLSDVDFDSFDDIRAKCLGNALALSQNGKWIGGTGGTWYAVDGAWIWSEENGVEELGVAGATVEVAEDGSMAVGRGDGGLGAWIWTREGGAKELNAYVRELGGDLKETAICGFYAMSPNARFLVGYSYDNAMNPRGYLVDLKPLPGSIDGIAAEQVKASVYPNPVVTDLHVDLPYSNADIDTRITLYDMQGAVCRSLDNCSQTNVINVQGLAPGIYVLDINAAKTHKVFKVVIR